MKKTLLVLTTLIITMLATTMVAFAGSATLELDGDGNWWYYNNGKLDTTKDGMVDYNGGLFIVIDGLVRKDFMGMCHVELPDVDAWYFFSQGQVQQATTGFAEYNGAWFYLNQGMLDSSKTGIYTYDGARFLVAEGRMVKEYKGLYQHTKGPGADNKWYFFANGQLQEQYTGLAQHDGEWFYLQNGCLAEDYTGYVDYDGEKFYVVNGMVKMPLVQYDVREIYGIWSGEMEVVSVSGAAELQKYLETICGRSLTATEKEGLIHPITGGQTTLFTLGTFEHNNNGILYPGHWTMGDVDMGSLFGEQFWSSSSMLTRKERANEQYGEGCIVLDDNNSFSMSVEEVDNAFFGSTLFRMPFTANQGTYGLEFNGSFYPGTNGDAELLKGEFVMTLQYGDMKEPYVAHYKYTFTPYY